MLLDGSAREPDEGGVGQGVPEVPGQPVDQVVLAAVGLVGNHHDVPALGQHRHLGTLLVRHELLDRGEDDTPRSHPQKVAKMADGIGLEWLLAEEFVAPLELAE